MDRRNNFDIYLFKKERERKGNEYSGMYGVDHLCIKAVCNICIYIWYLWMKMQESDGSGWPLINRSQEMRVTGGRSDEDKLFSA